MLKGKYAFMVPYRKAEYVAKVLTRRLFVRAEIR